MNPVTKHILNLALQGVLWMVLFPFILIGAMMDPS